MVDTPGGTSARSCLVTFVYQSAPVVTGISPAAGPIGGGNTVMITGYGFVEASGVRFGETPALSYSINSDGTVITATAPAHSAGMVDVTVETSSGTSTASSVDKYTFYAIPELTGISPASGPTSGGTAVTITGSSLSGATSVRFGSTPSPSYSISDDGTSITAVSPAHAAGIVDIIVETPGGNSALVAEDRFTYGESPIVTLISPARGSMAGNTLVTITGTGFSGATAVSFGAAAGTNLTVVSPTRIKVRSPAHAAGTVHVRVTAPGGKTPVIAADRFTYVPRPNVTSVSPRSGPVAGNTTITILGKGLSGATAVRFGYTAGTILSNTATKITARSPAHVAGIVDVKVTTAGGNSAVSAADKFVYAPLPAVTRVTPATGTRLGGTTVTVIGSGFTGTTVVKFGGATGTGLIVNSGRNITITSPPHAVGTVDIRVRTPGGISTVAIADRFRYT